MFYLTTHSTHFIYGYMASDICQRTIQIAREETRCCHMGCSFQLTARVLLYAPSHRQDNTYHGFCYTSRGALAGRRNNSMGPPYEGSICLESHSVDPTQRCQLVRFIRKPYGFLRFERAYGRTMQSLRIFMIFADSHLQSFHALYSNCCEFAVTPSMLHVS